MVGKKLGEVFSSLKDNLLFIFSVILLSITTTSCERSFQNFDKNLLEVRRGPQNCKKKRKNGQDWTFFGRGTHILGPYWYSSVWIALQSYAHCLSGLSELVTSRFETENDILTSLHDDVIKNKNCWGQKGHNS